jgi:hypothetical protein
MLRREIGDGVFLINGTLDAALDFQFVGRAPIGGVLLGFRLFSGEPGRMGEVR